MLYHCNSAKYTKLRLRFKLILVQFIHSYKYSFGSLAFCLTTYLLMYFCTAQTFMRNLLKKGPKSAIDSISLKDLPSGESLFGDVPKDIFEHIPGTLSLSEERRHNKLLSKSRDQAKNDEFSVGQNNRARDTSIHDAKTSSEKGNDINCKLIKK